MYNIKELVADGLTDAIWERARQHQVSRERRRLFKLKRIRRHTEPTPLVPCKKGRFPTINGQSYDYAHQVKGL